MNIDSANMEKIIGQILDQAPNGTTAENVTELYEKYKGNTVDILTDMWNIEQEHKELNNVSVEDLEFKNKIAEVRDICNAFDEEMEHYMQKIRESQ